MRRIAWGALGLLLLAACGEEAGLVNAAPASLVEKQSRLEALGKRLFEDERLSSPAGESCASCHSPSRAFTDSRQGPVSPGAKAGALGTRNAPSAMYAAFSPEFHFDENAQDWKGGQFWDGRAATLEEQAAGPFLNPREMHNASRAEVVVKVERADYAPEVRALFGASVFDDPSDAYEALCEAIAAFERTPVFAPFSSKYDAFLAGKASLNDAEARGLAVFQDPRKGDCVACHPSRPSADGTPPLFTDFSYDNLGLPTNTAIAADGADLGLGKTTDDPANNGRFKVPSLRNVAVTPPYFHNGYFNDLRSLVDFYNSRDVKGWPAPEVPETMNRAELGHLGLTDQEMDDLVAFLGTLTDGYVAASDLRVAGR